MVGGLFGGEKKRISCEGQKLFQQAGVVLVQQCVFYFFPLFPETIIATERIYLADDDMQPIRVSPFCL